MAARARRARPGHARRARAREGREDSHFALVSVAVFLLLSAPYLPVGCEVIGTPLYRASEDGTGTWGLGSLPDDGHE